MRTTSVKIIITVLFITSFIQVNGQQFSHCNVYQFLKNDSINKKIAQRIEYNPEGQITKESYNSFWIDASNRRVDGTHNYHYKDTLLQMKTFDSAEDMTDNTKTIYSHNKNHQLTKEEKYSFERILKKGVRGCVVSEDDYEKKRKWVKTHSIKYTYDKNGNKILYEETIDKDRHTWDYDTKNRITKFSRYKEKKNPLSTHIYTYSDHGHQVVFQWASDSIPTRIDTLYKDDKNRIVKEINTGGKSGKIIRTIETSYNPYGKISRRTVYNIDREAEVTHIYEYLP